MRNNSGSIFGEMVLFLAAIICFGLACLLMFLRIKSGVAPSESFEEFLLSAPGIVAFVGVGAFFLVYWDRLRRKRPGSYARLDRPPLYGFVSFLSWLLTILTTAFFLFFWFLSGFSIPLLVAGVCFIGAGIYILWITKKER